MKRKILLFVVALFSIALLVTPASAFLNNWYFDPDGAGVATKVEIAEWFDVVSPNLVDTTLTSDPNLYSFVNYGFVKATGSDGGPDFANQITGTYVFNGITDLTNGTSTFTSGSLDIYSDPNFNYGSTDADYGANDGLKIGSFSLLGGGGFVDPDGIPNGLFTLSYESTFLKAGYWFDSDGVTDLSTTIPISFVQAFTTTNASYTSSVNGTFENEMYTFAGYSGPAPNDPPEDFFLSANGQLRIDIVPEPGTMMLLGFGLLGLAAVSRRKVS